MRISQAKDAAPMQTPKSSTVGGGGGNIGGISNAAGSGRVRLQEGNKAKSMSVSENNHQPQQMIHHRSQSAIKSIPGRDEGDGLRKGLLTATASTKTLFGAAANKDPFEEAELDMEPDAPMVDVVKALITLMRVENAVWTEGNSHKKWQARRLG